MLVFGGVPDVVVTLCHCQWWIGLRSGVSIFGGLYYKKMACIQYLPSFFTENVGKHTIYWVFVYRSLPRKKRKVFPICLFSFRFSEPGHHTCLAQAKCLTFRSTPWVLTKCLCNMTRGIHSITSWWLNHPFEKYARQIGSFPEGSGWKFKKWLKNHHLESRIWLTATRLPFFAQWQLSNVEIFTSIRLDSSKKSPTGPIEQYLTVLAIYEQGSVGKVLFNF